MTTNNEEYISSKSFPEISEQRFNDLFLQKFNNIEELLKLKEVIEKSSLENKSGGKPTIGKFQTLSQLIETTFNFEFKQKTQMMNKYSLLNTDIFKYRPIKGDGNCFYRAVIFSFLEQVILNSELNLLKNFIFDFYNTFFIPEIKNYNFNSELSSKIFLIIFIAVRKNKIAEAYDIFVKSFINCAHFEQCLVLYFRFILKRFIKQNSNKLYSTDFQVKIGNLLPQNYETQNGDFLFEKFYSEYLMKMGKDAEAIIVHLAPYVLCIQIDIIMFDTDVDFRKSFKYVGQSNFKKNTNIALINRKEHYELVYTKEYYGMNFQYFDKYTSKNYQNQILKEVREENIFQNVNLLQLNQGQNNMSSQAKTNTNNNLLSFNSNSNQPMNNNNNFMNNNNMYNNNRFNMPQNQGNNNMMMNNMNNQRGFTGNNNNMMFNNMNMNNNQRMMFNNSNNNTFNNNISSSNNNQNTNNNQQQQNQGITPRNNNLCVNCQKNSPIQKFGITSLCQFCLINEIKIQLNSIYLKCTESLKQKYLVVRTQQDYCRIYIQIFNNEKITLPKMHRNYEIEEIIKISNTFLPPNNQLNSNLIFISLKKIYCMNCLKNINAVQQEAAKKEPSKEEQVQNNQKIRLPCDCNFCSLDCLKEFLTKTIKIETKMMSKSFFCMCTMNYEPFNVLDMIFLCHKNKELRLRQVYATIYKNMISDKCAICQTIIKTTGRAPNAVRCKNSEDRAWKIFGENYYINHNLCFHCYELGTLKNFFCKYCQNEHVILKEVPPNSDVIF